MENLDRDLKLRDYRDQQHQSQNDVIERRRKANYDVINGSPRQVPVEPVHQKYNADPEKSGSPDLAGRPVRGNSNMPYLVNASEEKESQVF